MARILLILWLGLVTAGISRMARAESTPAAHTVMATNGMEKASEEIAAPASLNPAFFKLQWRTDAGSDRGPERAAKTIRLLLPPRYYTVPSGSNLDIIDAGDGKIFRSCFLPQGASGKNEMGQYPQYAYLRSGTSGVAVIIQTVFGATEGGSSGSGSRSLKTLVRGQPDDGDHGWMLELGQEQFLQAADALAVSGGIDMLLLSFWNGFALIDAKGKIRVQQVLGRGDRLDIADRDADGRVEFYVVGREIACYEFIPPAE